MRAGGCVNEQRREKRGRERERERERQTSAGHGATTLGVSSERVKE